MSKTPAIIRAGVYNPLITAKPISFKLKLPVAPNTRPIPNNNIAVAKDPVKKYLRAASEASGLDFLLPTNTYTGIDKISNPIKNIKKSLKPIKQIKNTKKKLI